MQENTPPPSPENRKLHPDDDKHSPQSKPPEQSPPIIKAPAVDTCNHTNCPQTKEPHPHIFNKVFRRTNLTVFFTGIVAAATIAQVWTTCSQGITLERQGDIMERQILADNRPWISVDLNIASNLTFNSEGGRIVIRFTMKNVGASPAVGVVINAKFMLLSPHGGDVRGEQEKVCAGGRADLRPGETSSGATIFPGQEKIFEMNYPISRADMERSWADTAQTHNIEPDTFIMPVFVGCASYRVTFEGKIHKTRFVSSIGRSDPAHSGARFALDASHGDVPIPALVLDDIGDRYAASFAD